MLSSTGVKPSTSASGSQPSGNTKKYKIQQTPSSTPKNKVEAHHRKVKYSLKIKDCVVAPKGTDNVQHSKVNANSELKCVKCNGCMLSDNHDLCVLDFINNVNARVKSKSVKKSSKKKVWKPTGKVYTNIRYIWRPTDNEIPKPVVTLVYSRKPRKSKTNGLVSKSKFVQIVLWYLDSGCSKHMTRDRSQLTNFVNKFFPIAEVVAPVPAVSTGSPSSTTIDQDAPSPSNDLYFGIPIPEVPSDQSSSTDSIHTIVHPDHQISKQNSKWTKDHPIENIIGELARPVSTRLQLHEQALFCYYDGFLTTVEPKMYKDALTQSCWIKVMQEELNEFERLEVWELVPRPDKVMVITLKWIYKVMLDKLGDFSKGSVDPTLFIRKESKELFLAQVYVDDIIFAASTPELYDLFAKIMCLKFKMSMMGKISFFLGLQIFQNPRGIFINQSKYALKSLKKYLFDSCDIVDTPMVEKSKLDEDKEGKAARPTEKHLHAVKRIFRYLRGTVNRGLWYLKDSSISLTAFADAHHVGCQDTCRSTSGSMQFLGDRRVSWSSKRQKSIAISSTEAEYIAMSGCCAQILWMRSQLADYGLGFNKIPMYCDNKNAISLSCNNVQHSRSKHIDIRFHFIKEHVKNGVIELYFVNTEYQLVNIFTKALGRERIEFLINKLGMRSFTPETLKQLADEAEE
ncbi:retrovirus-related pol polyprotein from transposon TNT 1-94 [Tanacetum coccineum]